jgi:hypothetical protein
MCVECESPPAVEATIVSLGLSGFPADHFRALVAHWGLETAVQLQGWSVARRAFCAKPENKCSTHVS